MIASVFAQELEQESFDPDDFVERLAWRLTGGEAPDPLDLHNNFEQEIQNLQLMSEQCQIRIDRLHNQCREEEEEFYVTLERLQSENEDADNELKSLDDKINAVSSRVVHLGEQLRSVNVPRMRASEALDLMRYFNEFMNDQSLESEIFKDPDRLLEGADGIQKLNAIAQELPVDKFQHVQQRISQTYDRIERILIEEFVRVQRAGNKTKMKQIANIISQFKGYSQCLDAFVEQCAIGRFRSNDTIFKDIEDLCERARPLIDDVFPNPERVMGKVVLNMFRGKLQEHFSAKLNDELDNYTYLTNLFDLYSKTQKLVQSLSSYNIGSEKDFLMTLSRRLFAPYLDSVRVGAEERKSKYETREENFLRQYCASVLRQYYQSKGHQKKDIQAGGIQEFKRDIQARYMPESFGGESFLSEEVAINILQETKMAFQRCQMLSAVGRASEMAEKCLDILIQHLCQEHIGYAVELALYGIPLGETKTAPPLHFLVVLRQANAMCHLFEKQFDDSVLPVLKNTGQQVTCMDKMQVALYSLENKLSDALDRLFNAIVAHVRFLLGNEQKKTDFKPESEDQVLPLSSTACTAVTKYFNECLNQLQDTLDGDNLEACICDLGSRFHRVIVEHIYHFEYSSAGGMLLICDVNEYRKRLVSFNIPLLNKLFGALHALCNLLVVVPENLSQACTADLLAEVDRTVIVNFVQLRADYKSSKLYTEFR